MNYWSLTKGFMLMLTCVSWYFLHPSFSSPPCRLFILFPLRPASCTFMMCRDASVSLSSLLLFLLYSNLTSSSYADVVFFSWFLPYSVAFFSWFLPYSVVFFSWFLPYSVVFFFPILLSFSHGSFPILLSFSHGSFPIPLWCHLPVPQFVSGCLRMFCLMFGVCFVLCCLHCSLEKESLGNYLGSCISCLPLHHLHHPLVVTVLQSCFSLTTRFLCHVMKLDKCGVSVCVCARACVWVCV